jgi:hypothetical protein
MRNEWKIDGILNHEIHQIDQKILDHGVISEDFFSPNLDTAKIEEFDDDDEFEYLSDEWLIF